MKEKEWAKSKSFSDRKKGERIIIKKKVYEEEGAKKEEDVFDGLTKQAKRQTILAGIVILPLSSLKRSGNIFQWAKVFPRRHGGVPAGCWGQKKVKLMAKVNSSLTKN